MRGGNQTFVAPAFHGSRASLFEFWGVGDHAIVDRVYRSSRASWFACIIFRILGSGRPCNRRSRVSQLACIMARVDHCSQIGQEESRQLGAAYNIVRAQHCLHIRRKTRESRIARLTARVHQRSRVSLPAYGGEGPCNHSSRASWFARTIARILGSGRPCNRSPRVSHLACIIARILGAGDHEIIARVYRS